VLDAPAGLITDAPGSTPCATYRLVPVYRRVSASQRSEAVNLWLGQRAILESCLADRRSYELVALARAPDGGLAGTASVSLGRRAPDGRNVYNLRMYVAPSHRLPGLARRLTLASVEVMRRDSLAHPAAGVRVIAENPKLARPGARRLLSRLGFGLKGKNREGQDHWFLSFDPPPLAADRGGSA
jgi:GNAT superfamily N-acetyltransferase